MKPVCVGVSLAAPLVAAALVIACADSSSAPAPQTPAGSAGSAPVDPASATVAIDDAGASATPASALASTAADAAPAPDPTADSPNGKCRSASAPAPAYRAAAMAAAQSTLICYEYALRRHAPSPGHLDVSLDVNEDGSLRGAFIANDDFADVKMKSCAIEKLQKAHLPSPATGCGIVTKLPVTYMRADAGL